MIHDHLPFAGMVLILAFIAGSCLGSREPSEPTDLERMQTEIQNCILDGGHPRLGPNNTVRCIP